MVAKEQQRLRYSVAVVAPAVVKQRKGREEDKHSSSSSISSNCDGEE